MSAHTGRLIGQGRTAEVYEYGDGRVLKLFRPEMPPSFSQHEAEVARAVTEAGLPAPAFLGEVEVDGRPGIIYERVFGPSMLAVTARKPWAVARMARDFARLHTGIHSHTCPVLPALRDELRGTINRAAPLSEREKEAVLSMLGTLPAGEAVCHGDFHPDNIILSPRGPVVIDWTTATRGDPPADVARTALLFKSGTLPPGTGSLRAWIIQRVRAIFFSIYLRQYRSLHPVTDAELEAWRVPVAAARLGEGIREEESRHLATVRAAEQVTLKR